MAPPGPGSTTTSAAAAPSQALGFQHLDHIACRLVLSSESGGWAFDPREQRWILAPQDRTHVVTGIFAYRWQGWLASTRFRYTSGAPYTPVSGSFYSASEATYEPIFGDSNSARMPALVQADLRLGREFHIGSVFGSLFFDIRNATSHRNGEALVYSSDYAQNATIGSPLRSYFLGSRWQL